MSRNGLRFARVEDMPEGMRKLLHASNAAARGPAGAAHVAAPERQAAQPRHVLHRSGQMNKTEARYAQYLDGLIASGEVSWYGFEVIKLRLAADRCWFSVDFLVRTKGGGFELHEVKGRKGNGYFATEDGKLKAKFAAEKYPWWPLWIVWPAKGGGWSRERFGKGVQEPAPTTHTPHVQDHR